MSPSASTTPTRTNSRTQAHMVEVPQERETAVAV